MLCCSAAIARSKVAVRKWQIRAKSNRLEVAVLLVNGDTLMLWMNKHTSTVADAKKRIEVEDGTKSGCQMLLDVEGNELQNDTLLRAVAGCGDGVLDLYLQKLTEEGNSIVGASR